MFLGALRSFVTQRLAIHPAELRCFFTRNPVQHRRKRQKPSRLRPILRALRKPPNLTGRVVRPNRHRLAHGKHPSFANLNHVTGDLGIPRESPNRRVGISARMRMLVADIRAQWQELDRRIGEFDAGRNALR